MVSDERDLQHDATGNELDAPRDSTRPIKAATEDAERPQRWLRRWPAVGLALLLGLVFIAPVAVVFSFGEFERPVLLLVVMIIASGGAGGVLFAISQGTFVLPVWRQTDDNIQLGGIADFAYGIAGAFIAFLVIPGLSEQINAEISEESPATARLRLERLLRELPFDGAAAGPGSGRGAETGPGRGGAGLGGSGSPSSRPAGAGTNGHRRIRLPGRTPPHVREAVEQIDDEQAREALQAIVMNHFTRHLSFDVVIEVIAVSLVAGYAGRGMLWKGVAHIQGGRRKDDEDDGDVSQRPAERGES